MELKIGDKIRLIRDKEMNFTQSYVASQLGITTKAYGNIENNVSDPSYTRLQQLAEVFNCDINYIINYQNARGGYHNTFTYVKTGIVHQGETHNHGDVEEVKKLYDALLESERSRIALLEKIIKNAGLDF